MRLLERASNRVVSSLSFYPILAGREFLRVAARQFNHLAFRFLLREIRGYFFIHRPVFEYAREKIENDANCSISFFEWNRLYVAISSFSNRGKKIFIELFLQ